MRAVRMLVLGTLVAHGPMYGHQIRRTVELINLEAWSEVRVGSIYHALHQLEGEKLIEALRTERQGRLPARTVYAITEEGRVELSVLRERALREVSPAKDPFDVALWVAVGMPPSELEVIVRHRLDGLRVHLDSVAQERRQLTAKGVLPAVGEALMRHGEIRLEAEVRWHEELMEKLPLLVEGSGLSSPRTTLE